MSETECVGCGVANLFVDIRELATDCTNGAKTRFGKVECSECGACGTDCGITRLWVLGHLLLSC